MSAAASRRLHFTSFTSATRKGGSNAAENSSEKGGEQEPKDYSPVHANARKRLRQKTFSNRQGDSGQEQAAGSASAQMPTMTTRRGRSSSCGARRELFEFPAAGEIAAPSGVPQDSRKRSSAATAAKQQMGA